jgi:hypothetical protein
MANIFPYDTNSSSEWLNQLNNENTIENTIDYFFTQRKVTEYEESIDEKTLERKKKKKNCIYNFLALNIPSTQQYKHLMNLIIYVEIWGDDKFNFRGQIIKQDGDIPHLLLKLKEDKNLFVKLIFKDNEKILKTYINFIQIIKRYQLTPETVVESETV